MAELPYTRGQRTGENSFVGQNDERDRTRRELSSRAPFVSIAQEGDCVAEYNAITVVDPTDREIEVQLLTAATQHPVEVIVKSVSDKARDVTITAWGDETIDGEKSVTFNMPRSAVQLVNDARRKEWLIV